MNPKWKEVCPEEFLDDIEEMVKTQEKATGKAPNIMCCHEEVLSRFLQKTEREILEQFGEPPYRVDLESMTIEHLDLEDLE